MDLLSTLSLILFNSTNIFLCLFCYTLCFTFLISNVFSFSFSPRITFFSISPYSSPQMSFPHFYQIYRWGTIGDALAFVFKRATPLPFNQSNMNDLYLHWLWLSTLTLVIQKKRKANGLNCSCFFSLPPSLKRANELLLLFLHMATIFLTTNARD